MVAVLKPVNPSIATTSMASRHALGSVGEPGLERLFGTALDHVEQPGRTGAVTDSGQVDDHGDVLVTAPGVAPHVLVHANDPDTVEAVRVVDQDPLAFGQYGVVGGVPGDAETGGDPGHREVLDDEPFQRPPQPASRQPRPRFGCSAGVLPPHVAAAGAAVTPDRDQQRRRPPPERLVRQPPQHGATRRALAAAASAPPIRLDDPAGQHRPIRFEPLTGHFQAELVQPAEQGQISAAEARARGSVVHVEVFQMGSVGTSILGRPRPLSGHRRADQIYTLVCEEPVWDTRQVTDIGNRPRSDVLGLVMGGAAAAVALIVAIVVRDRRRKERERLEALAVAAAAAAARRTLRGRWRARRAGPSRLATSHSRDSVTFKGSCAGPASGGDVSISMPSIGRCTVRPKPESPSTSSVTMAGRPPAGQAAPRQWSGPRWLPGRRSVTG